MNRTGDWGAASMRRLGVSRAWTARPVSVPGYHERWTSEMGRATRERSLMLAVVGSRYPFSYLESQPMKIAALGPWETAW